MSLLEISDLTVEFPTRRKLFTAVDGVHLTVEPGEIHGLVGESGAGKSTVGAAVMGLLDPPGRIAGGEIEFQGEQISGLDAEAMSHALGLASTKAAGLKSQFGTMGKPYNAGRAAAAGAEPAGEALRHRRRAAGCMRGSP